MRIGMILDDTFPPDPRVENEAIALMESGHEVFLLCTANPKSPSPSKVIPEGRITRVHLSTAIVKLSALAYTFPFYHLWFKKSISAFISQNDISAVHIHDLRIARAVVWANRKFSLPIILDLHENRPEIMKHYEHVNTMLGKLLIYPSRWAKYELKAQRAANKVVVVTPEAAEYYVLKNKIQPDKLITMPNCVRPSFFLDPHIDQEILKRYKKSKVILYIGDTGTRRGLETVVEALPALIVKDASIRLVILGKSKNDVKLMKKAVSLDVDQYIDHQGWVDPEQFPTFITASFIGVCPILRNIHHDTTYANKIFQYMAFGVPVVVSDCLAQANLVRKSSSGLVHKASNVSSFVESIMRLVEDKALYSECSNNAESFARNEFSLKTTSAALVKTYDELEVIFKQQVAIEV